MASLLNMLNNFLGSEGKPSLFNVDSSNAAQTTDFKDLVSSLLKDAEVDQQTVSGLLLSPTDGVDLPLPAATGNGLPPLLATAAVNIEASLDLADAELPLSPLPNGGELLALQTPGTPAASTGVVAPSTLQLNSVELPLTPALEAPITATLQTPQLNGADGQVSSTQNPVLENTLTTQLITPVENPIVRLAEVDANATRPIKLDSVVQGVEQAAENTLKPGSLSVNATVGEPASVVPVPTSSTTVVPLPINQAPTALPVDARPQATLANDVINPGTASANVSTPATVVQTPSQPAAQATDLDTLTQSLFTAKDPQQLAAEQALGSSTASDNDASAETPRQALLPSSQPLRPAPTTQAPLHTADANFANVASMLNQGQTMNTLNERLQFMLLNGQNSAEIQLDPPELGSLQVRVTTRHEQTSVIFVAPNNVVREALEQQLPRLRDALEGAGLQLQDANVFAQTDDKSGSQPHTYADVEAADSLLDEELVDADGGATATRVSIQLVDAYI